MANWQRTLDIKESWAKAKEHEMAVQELAKEIAQKLQVLVPFTGVYEWIETKKEELIEEFLAVAEDDEADVGEFDCVMNDLYDWGNIALDNHFNGRKACWIATF